MTREEAKNWLNNLYVRADITDEYGDMEDMHPYEEAVNMAIKALEQENILDEMFENIKTEIDFIPTYGAKFADGSINVHVNKKDVLQIIDKYRGNIK